MKIINFSPFLSAPLPIAAALTAGRCHASPSWRCGSGQKLTGGTVTPLPVSRRRGVLPASTALASLLSSELRDIA